MTLAMYMGATNEEAEDATEAAMIDMLDRWETIRKPTAYARTAVMREVIKQRAHSQRFVPLSDEDGEHLGGGDRDPGQEEQLTVWEDSQWVRDLLNSLPPRQQEVMALIVDEFRPTEIAVLLGRDPAVVRQNLMAARNRLRTAVSEQRKTEKDDDATKTREDSFLNQLIPQVAEHLAGQHAGDFDAEASRARFMTWLAAHTIDPDF